MANDPAFLFYTNDFLSGIADLTMEERGQFITLLCYQHQKGHLTDKTIRLSVGSVSVDVIAKFDKDENGNFYNKRLQSEVDKRSQFAESRRSNGSKGGRPKTYTKPSGKPNGYPTDNLPEDVNRNVNKDKKEVVFPFSSPPFISKWNDWKVYKKTQYGFAFKSTDTEQAALNQLAKLASNDLEAVQVIEQSIGNCWKGLFQLKNNNGKSKGTTAVDSARPGRSIGNL